MHIDVACKIREFHRVRGLVVRGYWVNDFTLTVVCSGRVLKDWEGKSSFLRILSSWLYLDMWWKKSFERLSSTTDKLGVGLSMKHWSKLLMLLLWSWTDIRNCVFDSVAVVINVFMKRYFYLANEECRVQFMVYLVNNVGGNDFVVSFLCGILEDCSGLKDRAEMEYVTTVRSVSKGVGVVVKDGQRYHRCWEVIWMCLWGKWGVWRAGCFLCLDWIAIQYKTENVVHFPQSKKVGGVKGWIQYAQQKVWIVVYIKWYLFLDEPCWIFFIMKSVRILFRLVQLEQMSAPIRASVECLCGQSEVEALSVVGRFDMD